MAVIRNIFPIEQSGLNETPDFGFRIYSWIEFRISNNEL